MSTGLDPGMKSIKWCERDDGEDDQEHPLHAMYWWHHYACQTGVERDEIKSYLAFVWNVKDWTPSHEYEAESLCDRICFVQRNIRLQLVASYLPKIASSVFAVLFLFARSHFPCMLEAYGYKKDPT